MLKWILHEKRARLIVGLFSAGSVFVQGCVL